MLRLPRWLALAAVISWSFSAFACQRTTAQVETTERPVTESAAESQVPDDLATMELMVEGIGCASCNVDLRRAIRRLGGTYNIREGQDKQHLLLDFNAEQVSPEQVVQAVQDAGFDVELFVHPDKT